MNVLSIDLETYSEVDIRKAGLYRYAENAEILLFAYAWDDRPVHVVDFTAGETPPFGVLQALTNKAVLKTAYNAAFEMHVIKNALGIETDPAEWFCTMVQAYTLGLPGGLANVGKALGLPEDKQKLSIGKRLIQYFCKPCKPTKSNGGRTRNLPTDDPERWALFKTYNAQDVEAERAIRKKIEWAFPNATERKLWCLDQAINDRGVLIDQTLVQQAIDLDARIKDEALDQATKLTSLENPNSNAQALRWFEEQEGYLPETLDKKFRTEYLATGENKEVKRFFELKNLLAKTSVKKYEAMQNMMCRDGRVHGMLQFYGAQRTGRWAGRGVQLQNLPQNHLDDLDDARQIVRQGDYDSLTLFYDNPSDVLSQLIRTAFVAKPDCRFIVADFSAIEARVIAWLANETWRMRAFAKGEDIYCASATQMFGVPVVKHGVNGELRQKGKVAELACIAEGQLVLTDAGPIPIEQVTTDMKVWDGDNWVPHDGVVYRGEKEVMTYDGLTATPDHLVYVLGEQGPVRFDYAAACGARLKETGDCRRDLRKCDDYLTGKALERKMEPLLRSDEMPALREHPMDGARKSENRQVERTPALLADKEDSSLAGPPSDSREAALRKSERQSVSGVWCSRNTISLCIRHGRRSLDSWQRPECLSRNGNGQDRHEWRLCSWQHPLRSSRGQSSEPAQEHRSIFPSKRMAVCKERRYKDAFSRIDPFGDHRKGEARREGKAEELEGYPRTARVYDIRNAGPRHRYTVSGKLVHNCGYGGGVNALRAFGADKMGLSEEAMQDIVDKWRKRSPRIVRMWRNIESCAKQAIRHKGATVNFQSGVSFRWERGCLFMTLPSGRRIAYCEPQIKTEAGDYFQKESLTYKGIIQTTGGWGRVYTWGGKLTENLVQATARDCLAEAMLRLDAAGYPIVMHVHDEVILEMPEGEGSLEEAVQIMCEPLSWAPGLLLNADGYETKYYRKD